MDEPAGNLVQYSDEKAGQAWLVHVGGRLEVQGSETYRILQPENGETIYVALPGQGACGLNYGDISARLC